MPESWSKMEEDSKVDDKFGYETIQNRICAYLKDYADKNKSTNQSQGYTPLQAEFFVWKNIQLELAAEGVYNKLFDFKADNGVTKEDFKRKTLEEKLKSLKEILNSLQNNIPLPDIPHPKNLISVFPSPPFFTPFDILDIFIILDKIHNFNI